MMKFGTPDADDGPGRASMKLGFERVGEPSGLRSEARRSRGPLSFAVVLALHARGDPLHALARPPHLLTAAGALLGGAAGGARRLLGLLGRGGLGGGGLGGRGLRGAVSVAAGSGVVGAAACGATG